MARAILSALLMGEITAMVIIDLIGYMRMRTKDSFSVWKQGVDEEA